MIFTTAYSGFALEGFNLNAIDYLKIHLRGQQPLLARLTMKAILEKLPQTEFLRVHRSWIVPLSLVESVANRTILIGEKEIPIGASYEKDFYTR